jgi:hypothetical protein
MAHTSIGHATCVYVSTTTVVAYVSEEFKEFEDFEPKDDFVAHVKDPISSSGDEFDD